MDRLTPDQSQPPTTPVPPKSRSSSPTAAEPSGRRRRQLQGRLAGLSLPGQVAVLAVWPLLEQLMAYMVGTVDLSLAGHLHPQSLQVSATDALGVTSYVTWLIAMVHMAIGTGSAALIARAIGGRHRGLANATIGQSLILAVTGGVVVGAVVFAFAGVVGRLAGLQDKSLELAVLYLRIVALAVPLSAMLMVSGAGLRGAGDTRTPFLVMVLVNMVNVVASVLFVYGPDPIGGHGVAGIAAGTVLAWCVGAAVIVTALVRNWGGVRLHVHRLKPHAHTLRRIVRVGAPNLLESVAGMWIANFLVLMIVGRLGAEGVIGAHMIAIRIESLSFLSGYALGIAAATLTGQYLGLGDPKRARQAVGLCWIFAALFMSALGVAFVAVPRWFAQLITDAPLLLDQCVTPIRICGPIQIFFATQMVLAGAMRGAGDTRMAMWITTLSTYLVRLPVVYLLAVVWDLGLNGVWFALCGELVLRGLIFAGRFMQGAWMRVSV